MCVQAQHSHAFTLFTARQQTYASRLTRQGTWLLPWFAWQYNNRCRQCLHYALGARAESKWFNANAVVGVVIALLPVIVDLTSQAHAALASGKKE